MKVFPVRNPLAGEQVAAVQPEMKPRVETRWRRRLNLYAGRTLSHSALIAEQRARAAKMALLGQAVTPGVVTGLEIGLEAGGAIQVAPGLGITAGGEDVRLLGPLRVQVGDLRLHAPVSLLEDNELPPDGALAPRRLGDTLGALDQQGILLPRAFFLVLQPILGERIGDFDATDPCERDPRNEAFEDQQIVDGCRLIAWAWPEEWLPLPSPSARWRNDLAWAVFTREMQERAVGRRMPWEEQGVPVGLYSRDPMSKAAFLDRFSVVRPGGRSPAGSFPIESDGDPWLWQARLQQFAEHLTQLQEAGETDLARHFRTLPPVGLLPRGTAAFTRPPRPRPEEEAKGVLAEGGDHSFFSPPFNLVATPVPLDELETVFQASAPLAPVDLMTPFVGETIQILVPVPGDLYDPDLLVEEVVSDAFDKAINEITLRRAEWRFRRDDLRGKVDLLNQAMAGQDANPPFGADPDATAAELPQSPPEPEEELYGTAPDGSVPALAELEADFVSGPFTALVRELRGPNNDPARSLLREKGLVKFVIDLQGKVDRVDDKVDFGFLTVQTSIYKLRQLVLGNRAATRLATSPALAEIARKPSAFSTRRDLQGYLDLAKGITVPIPQDSFAPEGADEAVAVEPAAAVNLSSSLGTDELFSSGDLSFSSSFAKTSLLSSSLSASLANEPIFTKTDVIEQSPIVGRPVRTVTVAQRMQTPYAVEVRDAAVATKHRVVLSFLDDEALPMLADVKVPGMISPSAPPGTLLPTFQQVKDQNLAPQILQDAFDPEPSQVDEASYFESAVKPLDDASAILRVVEARLQLYRAALVRSVEILNKVRGPFAAAGTRLAFLEKRLAEARHDLVVAYALLEEERKRVADLNEQRERILDEHVRFLVYQRPRVANVLVDTPVRPLEPPPLRDPLPACQGRDIEPPEELREMLDVLREAPIRWFRRLPQLLQNLNRLDILQNTLQGARGRAANVLAATVVPPPPPVFSMPPVLRATYQTVYAQKANLSRMRIETAQVDLSRLQQQTWNNAIDLARRILCVGDLLDLPHGRVQVSQLTARELEQITQAVTCLYDVFGDVLPTMRLDWAERLSQFDEDTDLRSLATLPGWERIEPLTRRLLQGLVDWLFQRVVHTEPEAVAMMSDLIRVALLLASHAPVDRLVAAAVAEATTVKKGGSVRLKVNPALVRVGMHVLVYSEDKTVARGVLEDVGDGHAVARVVDAYRENVRLDVEARVQITEPKASAAKGISFSRVP